jgi:hypothetical protein
MLQKNILVHKKYKIILWTIILFLVGVSAFRLIIDIVSPRGFFSIGLPASMKVYISENGLFSINYPESWTAGDTPHGDHGDIDIVAVIKPFRTWPSLFVATKSFLGGDLTQVVDWGELRDQNLNGYEQESIDRLVTPYVNGVVRKYVWLSESVLFGEKLVQCIDYYIFEKESGYILKFCAEQSQWSKVEQLFQQMIDSFELR